MGGSVAGVGGGRAAMSIGEVLAVLQAEFTDVTVSKIRFLESEGLIAPERTASGYRKFTSGDLERLRLILRLQRDSFLPLKVIKERLADGITDVPQPGAPSAPPQRTEPQPDAAPAAEPEQPVTEVIRQTASPLELTESDLANAAGLDPGQVDSLREYGVICVHRRNGIAYFDADDLRVSKIARSLLKLGIEPRHMKTLRRIAEQEADMLGQFVSPGLRNRRPEARRQAMDTLDALSTLARELRQAYLTQSLRATIGKDG